MKCLAIIPARSGSKGLKDKNIKLLCGKPLMAYTIECALNSKLFDEVMVSTDSEKYASIAKKYGASIPFLRNRLTSSDKATTASVVKEVLSNYKNIGKEFDAFCILQPTSPLRTIQDLKGAFKLFNSKAKVAVVSVCEVDHSLLWCNTLKRDKSLNGFIISTGKKRRQDLEKYYRVNGAIYFCYSKEYLENDNMYRDGSFAYIMDKKNSIDIDDELDFIYAKFLVN